MKKKKANNNIVAIILSPLKALKIFLREHILKKVKARFLYLEVTHRCNLSCIACYTGAGQEKDNALTFEEQKSVVRQARKMGVKCVSLSGSGEPLLYKHLLALIDYICKLEMSVIIFTNGTLIDEATAAQLVSRNVLTFFKLYSLEPDVFDRMVGRRNAYQWEEYRYFVDGDERTQMIPSGLKALLEAQQAVGRSDLVKVETLVTKINVQTIPKIARFCTEANTGFFMETPVFKGKAIQNYEKVAVNATGYESLYRELTAVFGEDYMRELKAGSCSVEKNPVVWTDGRIGLCSSRNADIGNVRDEPLKSLFLKAKRFKQKEDRVIKKKAREACYFRTCPSRQLCELENDLPCDY